MARKLNNQVIAYFVEEVVKVINNKSVKAIIAFIYDTKFVNLFKLTIRLIKIKIRCFSQLLIFLTKLL